MALYGTQRDVSLFRHLNRELLGDIITQQCVLYSLKAAETRVNIYGEASGERYYNEPILLNALIDRGDNLSPVDDMGVSFDKPLTFKFFRDDLVDADTVPKVGDVVMWYENYFEIDNVNDNQLFAGKDPRYPYNMNPLNPGLDNFGMNVSIVCSAHYVPADKVQITKERL